MMMRPRPDPIGCRWTRDRLLPLVDEPGGLAPSRLGSAERHLIDAHLEGCGDCRDYLESLRGALGALELAAAEPPVDPRSPSLWPALQARIAAEARRAESAPPTLWARLSSRTLSPNLRAAFERAARRLEFPRDEWPARLTQGASALGPGLAAAAALLVLLTAQTRLQAWRADSESRIAEAEAPLAIFAERPSPAPMVPARVEFFEVIEPGELNKPSKLGVGVGVEGLARNTASPSPIPADPSAETASDAAPRYDFDLERGVPMPRGAHAGAAY